WSKELIERNHGAINKFLGDGFFAYWTEQTDAPTIARALGELRIGQNRAEPAFRVVLHYGEVAMGGASLGEESLVGSAVNMVFRIEKLAGAIGESRLMSEAAHRLLTAHMEIKPVGNYELQGFTGQEPYYAF